MKYGNLSLVSQFLARRCRFALRLAPVYRGLFVGGLGGFCWYLLSPAIRTAVLLALLLLRGDDGSSRCSGRRRDCGRSRCSGIANASSGCITGRRWHHSCRWRRWLHCGGEPRGQETLAQVPRGEEAHPEGVAKGGRMAGSRTTDHRAEAASCRVACRARAGVQGSHAYTEQGDQTAEMRD